MEVQPKSHLNLGWTKKTPIEQDNRIIIQRYGKRNENKPQDLPNSKLGINDLETMTAENEIKNIMFDEN